MGTNYYAYKIPAVSDEELDKLEELAKNHDLKGIVEWNDRNRFKAEEIHLGKSSCGWQFLFNHNDWKYYGYTQESIIDFMRSCDYIADEYGTKISIDEFWDLIDKKRHGLTGQTYHEKEVQDAQDKANGKLVDKYGFIPTVWDAIRMKNEAEAHNWYECFTCGELLIPSDLPYRFSNSIDFC